MRWQCSMAISAGSMEEHLQEGLPSRISHAAQNTSGPIAAVSEIDFLFFLSRLWSGFSCSQARWHFLQTRRIYTYRENDTRVPFESLAAQGKEPEPHDTMKWAFKTCNALAKRAFQSIQREEEREKMFVSVQYGTQIQTQTFYIVILFV